MKMKKTDIGVVVVMYVICGFFYAYSFDLDADSRTYPLFTIGLLFALTTLYLIQMIIAARKHGVESGKEEVFEGFKPAQFIVSVVLVIVYFFMMKYLGFFVATIVYMVAAMLYLKVPVLQTVIAVAAITLLIYLAFVVFLGVKLPSGQLWKLF